jgi:hypothetical protein
MEPTPELSSVAIYTKEKMPSDLIIREKKSSYP